MVRGRRLRRIADPVVAATPAGVRTRTRIHVTASDAAALSTIGSFLGSVYRRELAERIRRGVLDSGAQAQWRGVRKRAITTVASSRWAGTITRAVEDQFQLGMRGLAAQAADLRAAIKTLEHRCALRSGESAPEDGPSGSSRRRGYCNKAERFAKTRRLAGLRRRLATVEAALDAGRPSVVVGGKRLWRTRNHLNLADTTERQWRQRWNACRMFFTADGESGKPGGNETIRVDDDGHLRIKVPAALRNQLGSHLVIDAPVRFTHRGQEWAARITARQAVRYDVIYDASRGRWYLDASWRSAPAPVVPLDELREGRVLGVDLNADHLACCVIDSSGNPVGGPHSIALETQGLRAGHRDGRLRAAISTLLDYAHHNGCAAVVVENLDFADARAVGRETLGRGTRGKRLRRTVSGIPTGKFRTRLVGMAAHRGIAVIGVDAAYTSKWGNQHWTRPLLQQTSDPTIVTGHHGAAVAIGRRGLKLPIRRRPAGPRNGQRTAAGTPPTRPGSHRSHGGRRGSSGPPTHPP